MDETCVFCLRHAPACRHHICNVMAAQKDLVTVLGEFLPKLVKVAPAGERVED